MDMNKHKEIWDKIETIGLEGLELHRPRKKRDIK